MSSKARDFLLELDNPIEEPISQAVVVPEGIDLDSLVEDPLKVFNKTERKIIERILEGDSPDTISLRLALPISVVRAIATRQDVKDFTKNLSESMNELEVLKLKAIYSKALDARIDAADGDLAQVSKKDTLDIMKAYQELLIAERKTAKADVEGNIFVNILNQVLR